jgi:molybdopterin-guanine dinucleotide biosynthesis protein A
MTQIGGYVLAGGRSSRMGRDKALLELAGKPLIQRAVETLKQVCADVHILSSRPELAAFAPLVADLHPGCGPLSGVEAALLHAPCSWSLLLAVDMPFVPAAFLQAWVPEVMAAKSARVALFTVEGVPQPALCLLHREILPFAQQAIERGEFKLFPVLEGAARHLAVRLGVALNEVMVSRPADDATWFANLNTPEEFAAAEERWQTFVTRL